MKIYVHLWYLSQFFLKWEMCQAKVEKIRTHALCSITFFQNLCHLWDNGRARQATGDNIMRPMCCASWITKATDTHSEYVTLIAFTRQQWLRHRASLLRYTYVARPVYCKVPVVWTLIWFPTIYRWGPTSISKMIHLVKSGGRYDTEFTWSICCYCHCM
jgi:hypothetical protein